jgi:NAD(P)-dependent dehydrogenase (short-subunit alcohol dehydrogenase family)
VFGVCWGGVYLGTRTFLPMLLRSAAGHVVNTSSVNGFWACLGGRAHTAYSAAKFAVKGFTEALIVDFREHAPHLRASVVMPGHVGTSIVFNSMQYVGRDPKNLRDDQVAEARDRLAAAGIDVADVSDEDVRQLVLAMAESFRDAAPTTAAEAATIILDGVRAGEWRILVGADAHVIDELVRQSPGDAYEPSFFERLLERGIFDAIP